MATSAITAADQAFAVLAARPAPLAFDARGIPGLPQRLLDLFELRDLLAGQVVRGTDSDLVWRRLTLQARGWGPAWVVAAVGVAVPGLNRITARLSAGYPGLAEDIDSEVVAGFLHALRTEDVDAPRVWLRLMWAAWRSGLRVRRVREDVELPADLPGEASTPHVPYGHPDLVLGRAVAAGILTSAEADLIGDTRIGDVLIEQLADEQGLSGQILRMRRQRAERVLVRALRRGELSGVLIGAAPGRDRATQARLDGVDVPPRRARHTSAARARREEEPVA
jgi:hypothetical protein